MIPILILLTLSGQNPMQSMDMINQPAVYPMLDAVDINEYIIGPGDIFWFSVKGGIPVELSAFAGASFAYLTVTPDGYVVVPSVGSWFVSGRTLAEATDLVEAGFASRFPGLRADAGLAGVRTFRVPVTGQVMIPGLTEINGGQRLTDLLARAGGIASAGAWTEILIISSNGDTTEVDITGFVLDGLTGSNPMLIQGDRVHVQAADAFVGIEGAIQLASVQTERVSTNESISWTESASGMLEYIPRETVSRFVTRAGGTAPWAERDQCYIQRIDPEAGILIIHAPLDDPMLDPILMPGDRVVCPGAPPLVAVSGFVYNPGVYSHVAGKGAFYYISLAGGYQREASEGGVRIVLPDGSEIRQDSIQNIPPGAVITVPRSTLVWWQDPLLIVTSVATVIIAWKSVF